MKQVLCSNLVNCQARIEKHSPIRRTFSKKFKIGDRRRRGLNSERAKRSLHSPVIDNRRQGQRVSKSLTQETRAERERWVIRNQPKGAIKRNTGLMEGHRRSGARISELRLDRDHESAFAV